MSQTLGVDIASIASAGEYKLSDRVTFFAHCDTGVNVSSTLDGTQSWKSTLAPRAAEQAAGGGTGRRLVLLLWNGSNHFDALVVDACVGARLDERELRELAEALRVSAAALGGAGMDVS